MRRFIVKLDSIDKVKEFNNAVRGFDCNLDIMSGRYIVDGKSMLGILSIDLSKELQLNVYSDKIDISPIEKFIIEELKR